MNQIITGGTSLPTANGTAELAKALAAAQAEIKMPDRNKEVEVRMKSGGTYTFKYATLDHIIDTVRGPLTKNGLWFVQMLHGEDAKREVETILLHSSGQSLRSRMPVLMADSGNQALGSAISYMRRYALTSMLGIAAEDDDDANITDGNQVGARDKKSTDADWRGPLKKTALQNEMHRIERDVWTAGDEEELDDILRDALAIITQAKADLPITITGDGGDIRGLENVVKMLRTDMKNKAELKGSFGIPEDEGDGETSEDTA